MNCIELIIKKYSKNIFGKRKNDKNNYYKKL
jgi:hypothetical protein